MRFVFLLYLVGLFFVFTPGVLFTFPVKGIYKIALVHASLFTLAYYLTYMMLSITEGFTTELKKCKNGGFCKAGYACSDNMCGLKKSNETNGEGMKQCPNGGFCNQNATCGEKLCLYPQISSPPNPIVPPPNPIVPPPNPIVPPAEYPTRTCSSGKSCPYGTSCPKTDHGFPGNYCASQRLNTPNVFPCTKGETINGYCPSGSKCFTHEDGGLSCVTPHIIQKV
jgi:hypothetical protein